ncbi:MAG: hypothetical protein ABJM06_10145 [Gilvibacter sp.]
MVSQEGATSYIDLVAKDSVHLYFNKSFFLVPKLCSDYTRIVRLDSIGNFHGKFRDVDVAQTVIATGSYLNGAKHGLFVYYYPDGQIKTRGIYRLERPIGRWEYYYPDGSLESVWERTSEIPKLITFNDSDGNTQIDQGNGTYDGYGYKGLAGESVFYPIKGKIVNGLREGIWVARTDRNKPYFTETYENGVFKSGYFELVPNNISTYADRQELYIFKLDYSGFLDMLRKQDCFNSKTRSATSTEKQVKSKAPPIDYRALQSELRDAIKRVVNESEDNEIYNLGEYFLTIKFKTDELGQPTAFERVSAWGRPYYRPVRRVLSSRTYPYINKEMYFHFKIQFSGGSLFSFQSRFSPDRNGW